MIVKSPVIVPAQVAPPGMICHAPDHKRWDKFDPRDIATYLRISKKAVEDLASDGANLGRMTIVEGPAGVVWKWLCIEGWRNRLAIQPPPPTAKDAPRS